MLIFEAHFFELVCDIVHVIGTIGTGIALEEESVGVGSDASGGGCVGLSVYFDLVVSAVASSLPSILPCGLRRLRPLLN